MPGAVIPAGPAPAPERGTRESRRQGWQIGQRVDAAFESPAAPHCHSGNSRSPESLVDSAPGQLNTLDSGSCPEWRLSGSAIYEIPAALIKTLDSVSVKNLDSTPNCNAHGPSSTRSNLFRELFPERRRGVLFCRHEKQRLAVALPLPQFADEFFILGPGF